MVLQDIYASLSNGGKSLPEIDSRSIQGNCPKMVGRLLESAKQGNIDEETCRRLADGLQDVYEIKRLGDICRRAGHFRLAVQSYQKALSICGDEILRPVLQNNLGQAYARQGDLARAVFHYQKAASGFACAKDKSGLAHVQGNLGSAYRRSRDWDKAIEHCYRSLKIFEDTGDDLGTAQMTGSLGRIYADMGERELASRYFERSLRDFQRLGDKKSAAWVLDRLGRAASEGKDWDRALRYYHQSLSIFEDLGQRQSAGVVLSNQGRMYLEMGETVAACESLERAERLVPKNVHPAYQNALAGLGACYSILGRDAMQKARGGKPGDGLDHPEEQAASRYFAQASDRYLELASSLKDDLPELKFLAGFARSRSYLARLSADIRDEEASALAERALSALDGAVANCKDSHRDELESLRRTVSGMKEAWSLGLLGGDARRSGRAAGDAVEYLMGGARCSGDSGGHICDALRHLRAAVEAEQGEKDPAKRLLDAAASLRLAETSLMASNPDAGNRSAEGIGRAAGLLEGLANRESPSGASRSSIAQLDYGALRDALLPVGWALAVNALREIDDRFVVHTWDEDLNLVDGGGEPEVSSKIRIDRWEAESLLDSVLEGERPVLEVVLRPEEEEMAKSSVGEPALSDASLLVPVKAALARMSQGQILLRPQTLPLSKGETGGPIACKEDLEEAMEMISGEGEAGDFGGDFRPQGPAAQVTNSQAGEDRPDPEIARHREPLHVSPWSRSNAIVLFQALMLLVLLLLAVEAVLYLL